MKETVVIGAAVHETNDTPPDHTINTINTTTTTIPAKASTNAVPVNTTTTATRDTGSATATPDAAATPAAERDAPAAATTATDAAVGTKSASSVPTTSPTATTFQHPDDAETPPAATTVSTPQNANASNSASRVGVIRTLTFTGCGSYSLTADALTCETPFVVEHVADGLTLAPASCASFYNVASGVGGGGTRNNVYGNIRNCTIMSGSGAHSNRVNGCVINTGMNYGTISCTQTGCSGNVSAVMNGGTCVYDGTRMRNDVHASGAHANDAGSKWYSLADKRLDLYLISMSGACSLFVEKEAPLPAEGMLQIDCSGACMIGFGVRAVPLESVRIGASGSARVSMGSVTVKNLTVRASGVAYVFSPHTTGSSSSECSGLAVVRPAD